jgi:hypothetical protein
MDPSPKLLESVQPETRGPCGMHSGMPRQGSGVAGKLQGSHAMSIARCGAGSCWRLPSLADRVGGALGTPRLPPSYRNPELSH